MLDTVYLIRRNGGPFDRRQQRTTDRITDRCTETTLERLSEKLTVSRRKSFGFNVEPARHLEIRPIITLSHIVVLLKVYRVGLVPASSGVRTDSVLRLLQPTL